MFVLQGAVAMQGAGERVARSMRMAHSLVSVVQRCVCMGMYPCVWGRCLGWHLLLLLEINAKM